MRCRHEETTWRVYRLKSRRRPQTASLHLIEREESISRDDEALLARLARAGSKDAADALVCAHVRSVRRLAMKFRWWGVPVEDLVQEGVLGLLHAVPKYRPELGVRLLSFSALGVRRRMLRAIAHHRGQGLAAEGTIWGREFFRLRREVKAAHEQGTDAVDWLVARVGVTRETARAALAVLAPMLRLDDEMAVEGRPVSPLPNPEQEALAGERRDLCASAIRQALEELPKRERWIVEKRLMFDPPSTYRDLGGRLGISGERVKQLEVRALSRLRAKLMRLGIRSAIDP